MGNIVSCLAGVDVYLGLSFCYFCFSSSTRNKETTIKRVLAFNQDFLVEKKNNHTSLSAVKLTTINSSFTFRSECRGPTQVCDL